MRYCYITQVQNTMITSTVDKTRKEKAELGVFKVYDVAEKLDSFGDIIKDGIKEIASVNILLNDKSKIKKLIEKAEVKKCVNFKLGNKGIEFPTEIAKERLKFSPITVLAKGKNQIGTETGFIYCFSNKDKDKVGKISYTELASYSMKHKGKISNMFLKTKEGKRKGSGNPSDYELCSYIGIEIPEMTVGQKLKNQVDKPPVAKKEDDSKERRIIKIMRKEGFGAEVDKYKLTNKAYPEDTLFFYLELMEAGKKDIVGSMLTTQNYNQFQLQEIAKGIESGADIRLYADPKIDAEEMKMVRTALEIGQWKNQVVLPDKIKEIQRKIAKQKKPDPKLVKVIKEYKNAVNKYTQDDKKNKQ